MAGGAGDGDGCWLSPCTSERIHELTAIPNRTLLEMFQASSKLVHEYAATATDLQGMRGVSAELLLANRSQGLLSEQMRSMSEQHARGMAAAEASQLLSAQHSAQSTSELRQQLAAEKASRASERLIWRQLSDERAQAEAAQNLEQQEMCRIAGETQLQLATLRAQSTYVPDPPHPTPPGLGRSPRPAPCGWAVEPTGAWGGSV